MQPTTEATYDAAVASVNTAVAGLVNSGMQAPLDRAFAHGLRSSQPPSLRNGDPLMHPSVSYDARVIAAIDGYDEDTRADVGLAETALDACRVALQNIINARKASIDMPDWTPARGVLETALRAEKESNAATAALTRASNHLTSSIAALDASLRVPVKAGANTALSGEIRRHFKDMSTGDRQKALTRAIQENDAETMNAVLGAPAYLSGLEPDMQQILLRRYRLSKEPKAAKRLAVMQAALDKVDAVTVLQWTEHVEKAMDCSWATVKRVREQRDTAVRKFNGG